MMRERNLARDHIVNESEPEDLTPDSIAVAAQSPQTASVDGVSATAVSIPDQIAADKYRKASTGLSGNHSAWGLTRTARTIPPGTTG